MIKNLICRFSAVLSFVPTVSYAKAVYYDDSVETIPIVRDSNVIFRFATDVKTISQAAKFKVEPADPESPDYSTLSVTPRLSKADSKITFLLSDGEIVNVRLVVVPNSIPGKTDSFYEFKKAEEKVDLTQEGSASSEMALMKAMLTLEDIKGYRIKRPAETKEHEFEGLKFSLVYMYLGPKFTGHIFRVTNPKKESAEVDLTKLSWGQPNRAMLAQVDERELKPKESIFLRVVTVASPAKGNINIPTGQLEKK